MYVTISVLVRVVNSSFFYSVVSIMMMIRMGMDDEISLMMDVVDSAD